ncbi:MAG: aminotransferase class V-fold PLP-dependent enzyme [Ignavibacteriaceae bacterium]|nr:aminotransferase class V-fold PLP-dependent enzyme [Ignavibacteriaceae bacterium]
MKSKFNAEDFFAAGNPLAPDYSRFNVENKLLLTGHSHQAWPDVSREGIIQCWDDAAELADKKWERISIVEERVKSGYRTLMNDTGGHITLAPSTHDLIIKLLSALPFRNRTKIITTDSEFHTISRQLKRLREEGFAIVTIPAEPRETFADRMVREIDSDTLIVMISAVYYKTAAIARGLDLIMEKCRHEGAEFLVDAYHLLNIVPFDIKKSGLSDAFITGGGYKYCQLGEGNAFLRFPEGRSFRPALTGWFSEFATLGKKSPDDKVMYGEGSYTFAGGTVESASFYRAARVFDYFEEKGLTPQLLREVSKMQMEILIRAFEELDLPEDIITYDRSLDPDERAGFLSLKSPHAGFLYSELKSLDVLTDSREDYLRFGPAPYLNPSQLKRSVEIMGDIVRKKLMK